MQTEQRSKLNNFLLGALLKGKGEPFPFVKAGGDGDEGRCGQRRPVAELLETEGSREVHDGPSAIVALWFLLIEMLNPTTVVDCSTRQRFLLQICGDSGLQYG